jgi:replicative DNA helicase
VIIVSQLNRLAEVMDDGPRASNLKDSGAIEEDADTVLLIYRHKNEDEGTFETFLRLDYNRFGDAPVDIGVNAELHFSSFSPKARGEDK